MQPLGNTPFEHGLALAWSDGKISREGVLALDGLQDSLSLSDSERAAIEESFESELEPTDGVEGCGAGVDALVEWTASVSTFTVVANDVSSSLARRLGATALRAGLTREGWTMGQSWFAQYGLDESFAKGCWMEGGVAPPIDAVPVALAPVATSLGLVS